MYEELLTPHGCGYYFFLFHKGCAYVAESVCVCVCVSLDTYMALLGLIHEFNQ